MLFSITSVQFDEFFGFTDDEVAEMLKYFGLSDYHETIREWYDGYQFGKKAVYCPLGRDQLLQKFMCRS